MLFRRRPHLASALLAPLLLLAACETAPSESSSVTGDGTGVASNAASRPVTGTSTAPVSASAPRPLGEMLREVGVNDRVFFGYDSAELKPEGRAIVEGWAKLLRQYPATKATIEGHCDERGTREYNLALGERRAIAARDYLVSLGIDPRRISTVSYGKERPAAVGSNESAWAQNRRRVLVAD